MAETNNQVRFVHCANKEIFLEKLAAGEFTRDSIVFIAQEKLIWTQTDLNDDFYDCSGHEALTKTVEELAEAFGLFEKEFDDFKAYVENTFVVDEEISDESTNPVQNKVVKKYIDSKIFVGTQTEYDAVADDIAEGCIVIIIDQSISEPEADSGATSAVLGKGVLGQLILGKV